MRLLAALLLALPLLAQPAADTDRVVLKSGRVLEGTIKVEDHLFVYFTDYEIGDLIVDRVRVRASLPKGHDAGIFNPAVLTGTIEPPPTYVRYRKPGDGKHGSLDTGVSRWHHPQTDTTLFLVGAVHIGEESYFHRLQGILDSCDIVLFEGVGKGEADDAPSKEDLQSFNALFQLQVAMRKMLGLAFQKDALIYDRPFWKNADVSLGRLKREMDRLEVELPTDNKMVRMLIRLAMGFLDPEKVRSDPVLAKKIRRQMASMLAMSDRLMARLGKLATVLIEFRNEAAMEHLAAELKNGGPGRWLALFYGAAHLPDLGVRLKEAGWSCQGSEWVPAWRIL